MDKIAFFAAIKLEDIEKWLALDWIIHGMKVQGENKWIVTGRVTPDRLQEISSLSYVIYCDTGRKIFPAK